MSDGGRAFHRHRRIWMIHAFQPATSLNRMVPQSGTWICATLTRPTRKDVGAAAPGPVAANEAWCTA